MSTIFIDAETIEIIDESFGDKTCKFNPRTFYNPGWNPVSMDDLRDNIKKDGLNHPLLIIFQKEEPKLIAGERRLRAVLRLIEMDREALSRNVARVLVKNSRTRKIEPALDVYKAQGVECRITDATSEKEFLCQAIMENKLHESLTEYEFLIMCDRLERANFSRAEQAEVMGFSETWISQSHSLLTGENSHPKILEYMAEGILPRTAALKIIAIEDKDKQLLFLESAIIIARRNFERQIEEVESEVKAGDAIIEKGEANLTLAQFTGSTASLNKGNRLINRGKKKKQKAIKEIESIKRKGKRISASAVDEAINSGGNVVINKFQSKKKVEEIYSDLENLLNETLAGQNITCPETGEEFTRREVEIIYHVLGWVVKRKPKHPLDILSDFAI